MWIWLFSDHGESCDSFLTFSTVAAIPASMARAFSQMQLLGDSCGFCDLWEASCAPLRGRVFRERPGSLLLSSAFSDAELSALHTVGSGCGFFPGAVVERCWPGSERTVGDFSPSARRWRSRVASVSPLVRETEKWWKLPLFCFLPRWLPLSFSRNWCSPLQLCQELYGVASVSESSVISMLSLDLIVFLENAAVAMR